MSASSRFSSSGPVRRDPFDGILLVDKPTGPTSHDIVDLIRKRFQFDKVGHGGTLDPQATGLLIVMIGRGTKLADRLLTLDKTYEGTMRLGVATDSHDAQGTILRQVDASHITRDRVLEEMAKFNGDIMQTPPMVSAVKKNGVPLYKLARKGQVVERKPRLVHIYEFALLDFQPSSVRFVIRCSKGVYVRSICAEIGDALGCGAMLEQLRRTQIGPLTLEQALTLDSVLAMELNQLKEHLIPIQHLILQRDPPLI